MPHAKVDNSSSALSKCVIAFHTGLQDRKVSLWVFNGFRKTSQMDAIVRTCKATPQ